MADEKGSNCFPDFSYPFYPDGVHHESFIDYGSYSSFDFDLEGNSQLVSTRKRHKHFDTRSFYVAGHATIPLLQPSNTVYQHRNLFESRSLMRKLKPRSCFTNDIVQQMNDFYEDFPDVAFPFGKVTINEELQKDESSKLGDLCYDKDTKKRGSIYYGLTKENITLFVANFMRIPFCDEFDFDCKKSSIYLKTRQERQTLSKALLDINPCLLFELTKESLEQQKNDMLYFDLFQGNILGYCTLPSNQSANGMLLFPSGQNLESLNINLLGFDGQSNESERPKFHDSCQKIELDEAIRQIDVFNHENAGIIAGVRTQYGCTFYDFQEDHNQQRASVIDNFQCDDELVHLVISPYIPGDAVVLTTNGQAHIWRCGEKTDSFDVPSPAPNDKWPWYQAAYGGHPRCILMCNSIEAEIVDVRADRAPQSFFSVMSKQVDLAERISAVQRHPYNTHHYIIATDQSLVVMDDRYVNHPVLKWHHHLQDPVSFINVLSQNEDTIISVSGSLHRETHCFQYSSGKTVTSQTFELIDNRVQQPPVSTRMPWKVCPFDYWPSLLPPTSFSSTLDDRLKSSLDGIVYIPQENDEFSVLQMSSMGDLFYQPFTLKQTNHSDDSHVNNSSLSNENILFCKNWVEDLVTIVQGRKQFNRDEEAELDYGQRSLQFISLKPPHPSCPLCKEHNTLHENSQSLDQEVCPRCGIDINTGLQLQDMKETNTPLSLNKLSFGETTSCLDNFPEENDFQDTISTGFRMNWINDELTPIPYKKTEDETSTKEEDKHPKINEVKTEFKVEETNMEADVPLPNKAETFQCEASVSNTHIVSSIDQSGLKVTKEEPVDDSIDGRPQTCFSDSILKVSLSPQKNRSPFKSKRKNLGTSIGF